MQAAENNAPRHDPSCYLCPRNARASGPHNPDYTGPWAFDNDFPSLALDAPGGNQAATGVCRVLVWHPEHDRTLATLNASEMQDAVRLMRDEHQRAFDLPQIKQVMVFENRGAEIGVSNPHPHGQLYATGHITANAQRIMQADPAQVLEQMESGPLAQIGGWRAAGPHCARYPYEIWLAPERPCASLNDLNDQDIAEVADLLSQSYQALDGFFGRTTPLNLLWYSVPKGVDQWQLHAVIQPALRAPDKLKYFAGFEQIAGEVVNPVESTQAAEALREFF